jgi:hypothetical protein
MFAFVQRVAKPFMRSSERRPTTIAGTPFSLAPFREAEIHRWCRSGPACSQAVKVIELRTAPANGLLAPRHYGAARAHSSHDPNHATSPDETGIA